MEGYGMSFPSMFAGMLPPGVQQLVDSLPEPDVLERVAADIQHEDYHVFGTDAFDDAAKVAKFLSMLAQLIKQHGLYQQAEVEQTESLKLQCQQCNLEFAVDNALAYRRRVSEGYLCGCANGHEPVTIGSGRLGMLTPDEQQTAEGEYTLRVIYPPDYEPSLDNPNS